MVQTPGFVDFGWILGDNVRVAAFSVPGPNGEFRGVLFMDPRVAIAGVEYKNKTFFMSATDSPTVVDSKWQRARV